VLGSESNIGPLHMKSAGSRLAAILSRFTSLVSVKRRDRQLHLCEMLSLGEKRFVAVVEYGPERFLLAGTPQNISLLKHLNSDLNAGDRAPGADSRPE